MKNFFVLLCVFMISCSANRINQITIAYSPEEIRGFVEENHITSSKIDDVSRKARASLKNDGIILTNDTNDLGVNDYSHAYLFLFGTNRQNNKGYFIVKIGKGAYSENRCILFSNAKSVTYSHYRIPDSCRTWQCAQPFLVPNNLLLRMGGKTR